MMQREQQAFDSTFDIAVRAGQGGDEQKLKHRRNTKVKWDVISQKNEMTDKSFIAAIKQAQSSFFTLSVYILYEGILDYFQEVAPKVPYWPEYKIVFFALK